MPSEGIPLFASDAEGSQRQRMIYGGDPMTSDTTRGEADEWAICPDCGEQTTRLSLWFGWHDCENGYTRII